MTQQYPNITDMDKDFFRNLFDPESLKNSILDYSSFDQSSDISDDNSQDKRNLSIRPTSDTNRNNYENPSENKILDYSYFEQINQNNIFLDKKRKNDKDNIELKILKNFILFIWLIFKHILNENKKDQIRNISRKEKEIKYVKNNVKIVADLFRLNICQNYKKCDKDINIKNLDKLYKLGDEVKNFLNCTLKDAYEIYYIKRVNPCPNFIDDNDMSRFPSLEKKFENENDEQYKEKVKEIAYNKIFLLKSK